MDVVSFANVLISSMNYLHSSSKCLELNFTGATVGPILLCGLNW